MKKGWGLLQLYVQRGCECCTCKRYLSGKVRGKREGMGMREEAGMGKGGATGEAKGQETRSS